MHSADSLGDAHQIGLALAGFTAIKQARSKSANDQISTVEK